ncbi:transcriptional regulator, AraC family [Pseudovibrio denitrificans]|uniref:Transcriptional regulator, AraC family n=2 Tax=Pseudovibrio TaxID=258255 RepID=A0A1I7AK41_9HYPH|nr:transcriptional regulator, AraC family [Pseudovibrio denitrificans]
MQFATQQWLEEWFAPLAPSEGVSATRHECVEVIRMTTATKPRAVMYSPSIRIVFQGLVRGHLGSQSFLYSQQSYAALVSPIPLEIEIVEASPEKPLYAVNLAIDINVLAELMLLIEQEPLEFEYGETLGRPAHLSEEALFSVCRLMQTLNSEEQTKILADGYYREFLYHVLKSEYGASLRVLFQNSEKSQGIARVLQVLHEDFSTNLSVDQMAKMACMSISAFHAGFKGATGLSPLQYVKSIRLHKARSMMLSQNMSASQAAYRVGYASPSQFSREFKRFFGSSPTQEAAKFRVVG